MHIRDIVTLSLRSLIVNRNRTLLTMLGMIIGIGSVILMIGVGQSAERYLLSQIASFGSDLVFMTNGPGDETRGGPPNAAVKLTLTERDYERIKRLSWPEAVSASVIADDVVTSSGGDTVAVVSGSDPQEQTIFQMGIQTGRFLEETDVTSRSRVAVLGFKIAQQLFGQEEPLGSLVKIGKQPYRVIGVIEPSGTRFFTEVDRQVYIPFTAFLDTYGKNRLHFISVKTGSVSPAEAKDLLRQELRDAHGIENPRNDLSKDDFKIASQEDAIRNVAQITMVLQTLLGSIASISLLVAGIGIMNVMYVTVTERTREIGLRKAVGATPRAILSQFIVEAVLLTGTAGSLGILFGISLTWTAIQIILHFQEGWSFGIPWGGAVVGAGVSIIIGVLFGFFPARRAARLRPIEALRHE